MTRAVIASVEYHLPAQRLTNDQLAEEFPEWSVNKIADKTGIHVRHIAADGELSSDLAEAAARKLFSTNRITPDQIDFVLFCTQTPDFALPTAACLLQHRLGIPTTAGALDFNLGCSGYVYGLSLAKGLIETNQARCVLLLTGETYSKLLDPKDKTVRTLFGDAGAATLISADDSIERECIGPFVFGTDGSGGANLVCPRAGFRGSNAEATGRDALWMNGPEIFNFTINVVPDVVDRALSKSGMKLDEIDLFVFHQANAYMLEHLRKKLGVPTEKFVVALAQVGNTVSCTIPIALHGAMLEGRLKPGIRILLVGFGVGYSWSAAMIEWRV
jgi:3-oxoacyl-[acyl-carrier-protein] synthase III